jgi:hypothetical protein
MPVFQADVIICGTMYVHAETAQEAFGKVKPHDFTEVEFPDRAVADWLEVSHSTLDSGDLPEIALSPHMTFFLRDAHGKELEPGDFTETE